MESTRFAQQRKRGIIKSMVDSHVQYPDVDALPQVHYGDGMVLHGLNIK